MATREALIVTTSLYQDRRWTTLHAPGRDGRALGDVLGDPKIGGFGVEYVVDRPAHTIRRRVDEFLARRRTADELLVYLSCHGVKDDDGRLYLVGTDTEFDRDLLESTAVSAAFLNGRLGNCRARSKVLILDCCYSGAFDPQAKGLPTAGIAEQMRSAGTAVLTATNELQLAWEDDGLSDATGNGGGRDTLSVFTSVLVEGLRTGDADRDADGEVSVDDLFRYVSETMAARGSRQTPKLWLLDCESPLVIARRAGAGPRRAEPEPAPPADAAPPAGFDRAGGILAGVTAAADTIAVTVGPLPRFVAVRTHAGTLLRTTDTAVALRGLTAATPWSGCGLDLVRDLVDRMRTRSHDGAACAVLVLDALLRALRPALVSGTDPQPLARGLQVVINSAVGALLPSARAVEARHELEQVGTTVTGDRDIGRVVAEALETTGREGFLKIREVDDPDPELGMAVEEDLRVECARVAPPPGSGASALALDRPYIAVCDLHLSHAAHVTHLRDVVGATGRPLVVLARTAAGEVAPDLAEHGGDTGITVVTAEPEVLLDVGPWSGATLVRDVEALRHAGPEILGEARSALIAAGTATLGDGKGDVAALSKRIDAIRGLIRAAPSPAERERQKERLAALFGGIAVISVGAADEAARRARAGLVRVGIHSCRAAVDTGTVAGGAAALAHAGHALAAGYRSGPPHLRAPAAALATALTAPLLALAANSGEESPADVVDRLVRSWPESTYDAVSGTFPAAEASGIRDPLSVQLDILRAVGESAREFLAML